jgi:hypothetical protein
MWGGSQNRVYIKNQCIRLLTKERMPYVPRLTEKYSGHNTTRAGWGRAPCIFIGDVEPMNIQRYIRQFHIIDEYIIIFLRTEEYKVLYRSGLRSSVISSVNRGIYSAFLSFIGIFIGCN